MKNPGQFRAAATFFLYALRTIYFTVGKRERPFPFTVHERPSGSVTGSAVEKIMAHNGFCELGTERIRFCLKCRDEMHRRKNAVGVVHLKFGEGILAIDRIIHSSEMFPI